MSAAFRPQHYAQLVLDALHPSSAFRELVDLEADRIVVRGTPVPCRGIDRAVVLGLGKAAVPQVLAMRSLLAPRFALAQSLAVTKDGHGASTDGLDVFEAGHPLCDRRSLRAARLLRDRFESAADTDLIVLCLSGGGSALAVEPRPPFTLDDKIALNRELLGRGAPIAATNRIRQAMSRFKNGGLLDSSRDRRVLTLLSVDVPVDDDALVASGPTMPRPIDAVEVLVLAERWLSSASANRFRSALDRCGSAAIATPLAESSDLRHVARVGDWNMLRAIATRVARDLGIEHVIAAEHPKDTTLESGLESTLTDLRDLAPSGGSALLLSGGELTVDVHGNGRGGRNTEFVARAARALFHDNRLGLAQDELDRLTVFSLATDGSDGPTDSAGGYLTRVLTGDDALARAELDTALRDSDTLTYLEHRKAAFHTGATGTNLMDLRGIVIG